MPWNTAFSQMKYWWNSGWLRPSCLKRMARLWAVSLAPRMIDRRVAGQQVDQQEDQHRDDERHHHQLEEPAEEVLAHVGVETPARLPGRYPASQIWRGEEDAFVEAVARACRWGGSDWRSSGPGRGHLGEEVLLEPQVGEILGQLLVDRLVGG